MKTRICILLTLAALSLSGCVHKAIIWERYANDGSVAYVERTSYYDIFKRARFIRNERLSGDERNIDPFKPTRFVRWDM